MLVILKYALYFICDTGAYGPPLAAKECITNVYAWMPSKYKFILQYMYRILPKISPLPFLTLKFLHRYDGTSSLAKTLMSQTRCFCFPLKTYTHGTISPFPTADRRLLPST